MVTAAHDGALTMAELGRACLIIALCVCLYGVVASLHGARSGRQRWVDSGRRAAYALLLVTLIAYGIVTAAFARADLSFALVSSHSSTTTPLFYRLTGLWSSQEGSLLLWLLLLSFWASLILFLTRRRLREVAPYAAAVLLGFGAFFSGLLVFLESPFNLNARVPAEGAGLNPLLRDPGMIIHPPMLYSGYTLFAVPFAFAVGALITRRLDAQWIRSTRPFTLGAWALLGFGIALGARWSYRELGWGGYWAWDPVENASLMPWLTGTAFLHSVMIQERRGMLKVWNVSLVLATGVLAILGTFLVRSGILDSIHAFGASTLGVPFLALIVVMVAGSTTLVASRAADLRSDHKLDSLLSREAVFLLNNLVLVGMCFVIFWGTFFPLISEALSGQEASVGPPWFDRYTVPLALILVLLSGVGPVMAWRRATPANLRRNLLVPSLLGALVGAVLVALGLGGEPAAVVMFGLGAFVVAAVGQELQRGVRARRVVAGEPAPLALVALIRRNRRRYGGYIVHVGVAVLFVGVAASSSFQDEREMQLSSGQSARIGDYEVTYGKPIARLRAAQNGRLERIDLGAELRLTRNGRRVADLPAVRSYFPSLDPSLGPVSRFFDGEATSEIALQSGWRRDVWAAIAPDIDRLRVRLQEGDRVFSGAGARLPPSAREQLLAEALGGLTRSYARDAPPATFRVLVNPLVNFIWLGVLVAMVGGLIALWPSPRALSRTARAAYAARVGRALRDAEAPA